MRKFQRNSGVIVADLRTARVVGKPEFVLSPPVFSKPLDLTGQDTGRKAIIIQLGIFSVPPSDFAVPMELRKQLTEEYHTPPAARYRARAAEVVSVGQGRRLNGQCSTMQRGPVRGGCKKASETELDRKAKKAKSDVDSDSGNTMQSMSAKDAKYGFGRLIDLARSEPVVVNSIAWLAHQLVRLAHDTGQVFDSVIVVTDRRILDQQIRDTIKQFAQVGATVGHAGHSGDLRRFIADGKKIIITTVQKFPFILDDIGSQHRERSFAIIIDEAHSRAFSDQIALYPAAAK